MIAVRIEGRLGNQLFQYAFIYATAKRLKTTFYIDKSIEIFLLPQYFEIKNDFFLPFDKYIFSIKGYKNLLCIHLKTWVYRNSNRFFLFKNPVVIGNEKPFTNIISNAENKHLYIGFFQSEKYFESCKSEIAQLFTIKAEYKALFNSVFKQFECNKHIVVVHIRRGDYVDIGWSLGSDYYHKAIKHTKADDPFYIFISDDYKFVEKEFSHVEKKYISRNSEIVDLQFLMNANTCILSASSFSWWGAYLNFKKNNVIVPKYWLGSKKGKEYPDGIILKHWMQI